MTEIAKQDEYRTLLVGQEATLQLMQRLSRRADWRGQLAILQGLVKWFQRETLEVLAA